MESLLNRSNKKEENCINVIAERLMGKFIGAVLNIEKME